MDLKIPLSFRLSIVSALLLILALSLTGCAKFSLTERQAPGTQGAPLSFQKRTEILKQITRFDIHGKVAYKNQNKGGNASLVWHQMGSNYTIDLIAALGAASAHIKGGPRGVKLTPSKGETQYAANPEQLLRQTLGVGIPVSPLQYWIRGIPAPGTAPACLELDSEQRIRLLTQRGWTLHYHDYMIVQGLSLPRNITLELGQIRIRILIRSWDI